MSTRTLAVPCRRREFRRTCAILRRPLRPLHQEEPRKYPRGKALAVQQHDDIIANHFAKAPARDGAAEPAGPLLGRRQARLRPRADRAHRRPRARAVPAALGAARGCGGLATAAHAGAVVEAHASSLDEVWIDTGTADAAAAQDLADELRRASRDELGFDVSVGVGRNKSVAKLASCLAKPERTNRGVVAAVAPADLVALLSQTPLAALPSDGRRARRSDAVVAAVAAELGHGSGAPPGDAKRSRDRVAALLRSCEDPAATTPTPSRASSVHVRGDAVNEDDARAERPQESISLRHLRSPSSPSTSPAAAARSRVALRTPPDPEEVARPRGSSICSCARSSASCSTVPPATAAAIARAFRARTVLSLLRRGSQRRGTADGRIRCRIGRRGEAR